MTLYVARHGETDWNAQGRYQGSVDIPLNGTGLQQAAELAERVAALDIDVIISSPLLRARMTAEVIQRAKPVPLVFDARLVERNMGVYEGLTRDEARTRLPETWARLGQFLLDDAPECGETIRQVDARVTAALEDIKINYHGKNVLLVCHGFVSRAVNRYLYGLPFDEMHGFTLGNCEVAEYAL